MKLNVKIITYSGIILILMIISAILYSNISSDIMLKKFNSKCPRPNYERQDKLFGECMYSIQPTYNETKFNKNKEWCICYSTILECHYYDSYLCEKSMQPQTCLAELQEKIIHEINKICGRRPTNNSLI